MSTPETEQVGPHDVHLLPNHPEYRDHVTCRACGAPSRPSIERDLWWGYLCPAMANIGALKQAQSDLIAIGTDWAEAGRILSRVQRFYVDAVYEAAQRYVAQQVSRPGEQR